MKLYRQDLLVSRHTLIRYRVVDIVDNSIHGKLVLLQRQRSSYDDLLQKVIIITELFKDIPSNYIKPSNQDYYFG
jgi:hypothetical protein